MTPLELQALFQQAVSPINTLGQGRLALAQLNDQRMRQDALRAQALADARGQFDYEMEAREGRDARTREARRAEALKNGRALLQMQDTFEALNAELAEATQLTPEQEKALAVMAVRQAGLSEKWQRDVAKDPRGWLMTDSTNAKDLPKQNDARELFQALVQQQLAVNAAQPKAQQVQRRLGRVSRDMDLFTRTADIAFDPEMLMREQARAPEAAPAGAPGAAGGLVDALKEMATQARAEREARATAQAEDPTAGLPVPEDVRAMLAQSRARDAEAGRMSQIKALEEQLARRREQMGLVDRNFSDFAMSLRPGARPMMPAVPPAGALMGVPSMAMPQVVDPMQRATQLGQRKQALQQQIDALSAQLAEIEGPPTQLPEFVTAGVQSDMPEVERMNVEDLLRLRADAMRGTAARSPWLEHRTVIPGAFGGLWK